MQNLMGIGFGAVVGSPKSDARKALNPLIRARKRLLLYYPPAILVGEPSVYTTGFPEGWRNQTFW